MRVLAALLAGLLLNACNGVEIRPGQGSHARREVPPGPGLFTGKSGEFVLSRGDKVSAKEQEGKEPEN